MADEVINTDSSENPQEENVTKEEQQDNDQINEDEQTSKTETSVQRSGRNAPTKEKPFVSYDTFNQTIKKSVKFNDSDSDDRSEECTKLNYEELDYLMNLEECHNIIESVLFPDPKWDLDYDGGFYAQVIAQTIVHINQRATSEGISFAPQYLLPKGLKIFGERGKKATIKEAEQLHKQNCFTPRDIKTLTHEEKHKTQDALMFLTKTRDGKIKGRLVFNGKPARQWLGREESTSPTASFEGIF